MNGNASLSIQNSGMMHDGVPGKGDHGHNWFFGDDYIRMKWLRRKQKLEMIGRSEDCATITIGLCNLLQTGH